MNSGQIDLDEHAPRRGGRSSRSACTSGTPRGGAGRRRDAAPAGRRRASRGSRARRSRRAPSGRSRRRGRRGTRRRAGSAGRGRGCPRRSWRQRRGPPAWSRGSGIEPSFTWTACSAVAAALRCVQAGCSARPASSTTSGSPTMLFVWVVATFDMVNLLPRAQASPGWVTIPSSVGRRGCGFLASRATSLQHSAVCAGELHGRPRRSATPSGA